MTLDPGAPTRHPVAWQNPEFFDGDSLDKEMRRVFDICHGCRRCFNLCDSFPRLFDLIDDSDTGEVDGVSSESFENVVDACTLCDMCFMAMCPYTPPHEWNIDFPHLMLRYRAKQHREGKNITSANPRLAETDKNGRLARFSAPFMNWGAKRNNRTTRFILEKIAGIHRKATLPKYFSPNLVRRADRNPLDVNHNAPAFGRKVVLYATCFGNYNSPSIGEAARAVLAHNGVETTVIYPRCCGMPQFEQGNIERVAENAQQTALELCGWIDKGYAVVALIPSCSLMLKLEWPLLLPDNAAIKQLAENSFDISEYIMIISRSEGLTNNLSNISGDVTLHMACHARAQNIGYKSAEMLRLIPELKVEVIERCSGHGGSIGVTRDFHETALKVGKPVAQKFLDSQNQFISSECPLAATHIVSQTKSMFENDKTGQYLKPPEGAHHPIEILAMSYRLTW